MSDEKFLKKRTKTMTFIQCRKCSMKIEAPPTAQIISCINCGTHNMLFKTSSQSSLGHNRVSRLIGCSSSSSSFSSSSSYSLQINKEISNSGCPQQTSNKRALLVGVSYKGLKYRLKGTVNDVTKMERFLTQNFKFPKESIRILTEDQLKDEDIPTKKNIEDALKWLVEGCRSGDSLVFYFSGHGLRQPDFDGDEKDGYDETICPVDFKKEGMILDNDINSIIVKPLPTGVRLHAIIDACHSGTILDLHYVYNRKLKKWEEDTAPSGRPPKGTKGGLAISISACDDSQRAVDTTVFSEKGKHIFSRKEMNGAMTTLFIKAVETYAGITYAGILDFMNNNISQINTKRGCLRRPSIRRLFNSGLVQDPQLSSSMDFDVDEEFEL